MEYHKAKGSEEMYYFDVVSLYPTVMALADDATDFATYVDVKEEEILSGSFIGLVKADITPPGNPLIPVLPEVKDSKLMFDLAPKKEKTYTSVELKKALEKGCTIVKFHSALKFKRYTGLMKNYVAYFLKMKIETTQEHTKAHCDAMNQKNT